MTWAALLADALVGTDRRGGTAPELLDRAGAWAAYRRAGARPAIDDGPRPPAAAPETRPLVGEAAAQRLERLLDSSEREILHEWLELVRDRGRRIPPELLPALLDLGRTHVAVRPMLAEAGGARVRWLTEQNPEWTYLTREAAESQNWETGSLAERRGYLAALRRRDPAQARALVSAEWATFAAPERAELLATFGTGLGIEDEPLLEAALDDRRKEVRAIAAGLLTVLPGSAYQARATARARQHMSLVNQGVVIRLPQACDPGMRRDGFTAKPPAGTGERAWWLEEILARAPLSAWPLPPATLLDRLRGNEWAPTVHRGLARSAAAQRDGQWAVALLDTLGGDARDRELAANLQQLLPPGEIVARASKALAAGSVAGLGPLLQRCPRPWPLELSHLVLSGLSGLVRRRTARGELYHLARLAALRLPVTLAPAALATVEQLRDVEGIDTVPLAVLAETLSLRYQMTQEIA